MSAAADSGDGRQADDHVARRQKARELGMAQARRFVEVKRDIGAFDEAIKGLVGRHQDRLPDDPASVVIDVVLPRDGRMSQSILVAREEVLVWESDVSQALSVLQAESISVTRESLVTPRVRRLIVSTKGATPEERGAQLLEAIEAIRRAGLRVSANHILPFFHWYFKASASPELSPLNLPPRPFDSAKGAGVKVAVIDTGLDDEAAARGDRWLADILGDADPGSLGPTPALGPAAGHGTFVSGIIRQVAPGCTVQVYRALDADGIGGEVQVAQAILKAAAEGADVINLSLGGSTLFGDPPLAIEDALANIPQRIQVVAAAGNDGTFTPTWPAAFKRVVSVGALNYDMTPAIYSNRGPWVDVATVGTGAVSTFVTGTEVGDGEVYNPDSPCAVWSGTSFASPQVAGLLAVMLADGIEPLSAVPALLAVGQPMPNFGSTLRILDW